VRDPDNLFVVLIHTPPPAPRWCGKATRVEHAHNFHFSTSWPRRHGCRFTGPRCEVCARGRAKVFARRLLEEGSVGYIHRTQRRVRRQGRLRC